MAYTFTNFANVPEIKFHENRKDAVTYLINVLGRDYANTLWASDDGERLVFRPGRSFDFTVVVYDTLEETVKNCILGLDDLKTQVSLLREAASEGHHEYTYNFAYGGGHNARN